ncbi:MAG: hypothetical protein KFF77_02720 [Bacteroidetes bacterium]|nr:hypothetical protein [Bacteroidota bacterium]
MSFEEAMEKGFLNIETDDADALLAHLFDEDDASARLDAGLALLGTFVSKERITIVLDLAQIIIDANEELEFSGGGVDLDDDE